MINNKIAIVGSGVTGLSTAISLKKKGREIHLFDRNSDPGGAMKTEATADWRYELGPNTILLKDPEVEDLIDELNLSERVVVANQEASKRFIVKKDKLTELPTSLSGFLKTPLFSAGAKLRLLGEPFPSRSDDNATMAEFFEHRFGKEILDYAVNPFVAGIHAGKPEDLSVRHCFPTLFEMEQSSGSVLLGAIKKMAGNRNGKKTKRRLISFRQGLSELPAAMISKLDHTYLNHEVSRISKKEAGWHLQTDRGEFGPYSDVICTIPLHKWNKQLLPLHDEELETVKSVQYPPLSMLILGYKKDQISHPLDGFGFLVPEKENRSILGALITSTLFKGRAPEGHHLLTIFIGGGRQPELAELDSDKLLSIAENDLADLIGLSGEAVFKDHIYWPNSIPQYHPEYRKVISVFEEIEKRLKGLHLAGNFRGGISVPDCIKNGLILAEKLAR